MDTSAVVFQGPEQLELQRVVLTSPQVGEAVVAIEWSAISTGTERLLWRGEMPAFPGLGYPLVPGYESVGRVIELVGPSNLSVGDRVFVPGASCFEGVRGLFGGAAAKLVVPTSRLTRIDLGEEGVLLALAATAQHALAGASQGELPDLIVGHGVLGRLVARLAVAAGGAPVVWEKNEARRAGADGYVVVDPDADTRKDYRSVYDVSGDTNLVDVLLGRIAKGGELVLAGFYPGRVSFAFPLAFMKEARIRIAAEWKPADLEVVLALLGKGRLSLAGLITHHRSFDQAADAYATAFTDPDCLKMLLDWRKCS